MTPRPADVLRVGPPAVSIANEVHRVEAAIGREQLWFESRDVPLGASTEAFASAAVMPAAATGARLEIEGRVSGQWLTNVAKQMEIWDDWWGLPVLPPRASEIDDGRAMEQGVSSAVALCFTGGVDSFLRHPAT